MATEDRETPVTGLDVNYLRLRRDMAALSDRVYELEQAYPSVAGMTPAQRKGVIAGAGGAAVALVAVLPQVVELLRPVFVALGWATP